jgi:hypothetical protein
MSKVIVYRICLFLGTVGFLVLTLALLDAITVHAADQGKEPKKNLEVPKDPPIKELKGGKFVKPPASTAPTSYFYALSSKGDPIGQGQVIAYRGDKLKMKKMEGGVAVSIGGEDWSLEIAAPKMGALKVGEYPGAKRYGFNDDAPGLDFGGMGRGSNTIAGKFVVWEFEMKGDEVTRLAVDFVQQSEEKEPPLYGIVRFNSSFR